MPVISTDESFMEEEAAQKFSDRSLREFPEESVPIRQNCFTRVLLAGESFVFRSIIQRTATYAGTFLTVVFVMRYLDLAGHQSTGNRTAAVVRPAASQQPVRLPTVSDSRSKSRSPRHFKIHLNPKSSVVVRPASNIVGDAGQPSGHAGMFYRGEGHAARSRMVASGWDQSRSLLGGGASIIEQLPAPKPYRDDEFGPASNGDFDRQELPSLNSPLQYNLRAMEDQQQTTDVPLDEDLKKDFESMVLGFGVTVDQQTEQTLLEHIDYQFLENTRRSRLRLGDALSQLLVQSYQAQAQLFSIEEADADIQIEQGTFDWIASLEQIFADQEQPTQSELDAGLNQQSLEQRTVQTNLGISQLNRLGGQFSLNQNLQRTETNSEFANAADQFSSQFSARYEQPLLRNAGRDAVTTRLQIAGFRSQQQRNAAAAAIAEQMVSIANAYWTIAQQRCSILAIDDGIKLIEKLNEVLQLRSGIDASPFIRSRAPSVLKDLHRQAAEAIRQLGQQQIEFSRLVNDRDPVTALSVEIIPLDQPPNLSEEFDPSQLVEDAVVRRPEVVTALREINVTAAELRLSKNQLLPSLSTFVELQVQGLSETNDFANSLGQQRRADFPSTQFGLVYQLPIQNRSARGNNRRALAAYRRSLLELEQAIADTRADVSTAVNDLNSLQQQAKLVVERIQFNLDAILALEVERLGLPPEQGSPTFTLNTLIDQIIQLTADRNVYFQLIRDYRVAEVQLNQATGSLIQPSELGSLVSDFKTTSVAPVHFEPGNGN